MFGIILKSYLSSMLWHKCHAVGAQWLSGRVLDSRPRGLGFEPHRRHCIVSLSKNINPSLVLVQPRKTSPYITERLLMGRKESNQTNKQKACGYNTADTTNIIVNTSTVCILLNTKWKI